MTSREILVMKATEILGNANVTGGVTVDRVRNLANVLEKLTAAEVQKLRIVEVSDEHTGQRYGRAECRVGCARKLGGGGRNKGDKYAYQVWADWS